MATLNIGIKVNGAIAAQSAAFATNLYTAPANGYAIVQAVIGLNGTGSLGGCYITVGGQVVAGGYIDGSRRHLPDGMTDASANAGSNSFIGPDIAHVGSIYVGPGQTLAAGGHAGNVYVQISGIEFVNTM